MYIHTVTKTCCLKNCTHVHFVNTIILDENILQKIKEQFKFHTRSCTGVDNKLSQKQNIIQTSCEVITTVYTSHAKGGMFYRQQKQSQKNIRRSPLDNCICWSSDQNCLAIYKDYYKTRLRNRLGERSIFHLMKIAMGSPQKLSEDDFRSYLDIWTRKPRKIVV